VGGFRSFVDQRNWMEEKAVHRSLFHTQWKRLVGRPRHRWKILTSYFIQFDVAGGIICCRVLVNPE
jgi:hypothetical protein